MIKRKKHANQWNQRRVALVASDAYHTIHLINVLMPVRVKERTAEDTIYEGPIKTVWDGLPKTAKTDGYDLVGALVAAEDMMIVGRIGWMKDSGTVEAHQEGAERIGQPPRHKLLSESRKAAS